MNELLFIVLTVLCIVLTVIILWRTRPHSDIPGPTSWPLFGNLILAHEFIATPKRVNFVEKMTKRYGQIFRLFVGSYQIVVVQGHNNIMEVLKKRGKDFMDRPSWLSGIRLARRQYGEFGVSLLNGDEWKTKRRFIHGAFKELGVGKSSNEDKILEEVEYLVAFLGNTKCEKINNMKDVMMKASCNIIHNVIFGNRYEYQDDKLEELIDTLNVLMAGPVPLLSVTLIYPIFLLFFNDGIFKRRYASETLRTYIKDQIRNIREFPHQYSQRNLVDIYLESLRTKKIEETTLRPVTNEILEFFTAGTDTTAATLDWCILYMIQYPDIQAKCYEEIQSVTGGSRAVTYSDKRNLSFVEATILEVQRRANPTFFSLPHSAVQDSLIGGYRVPKNTIVLASLISAHMDKEIWTNPEVFNPNRFIGENKEIINKENLIPFSVGPRMCVGEPLARMEVFLIFSNLIQKFKFSKCDSVDLLSLDGCDGITRSAVPYKVKVVPRT